MKSLAARLAVACAAIFVLVCILSASVLTWYAVSTFAMERIETWENTGTANLHRIHRVLVSCLEWSAKERALAAIGKILDPSSLKYMLDQLYHDGHWWRYGWDGEEAYHVDAFRQDVMYGMCLYGDEALSVFVQDLRCRGHRVSDCVIWGLGLLKTEHARSILEGMAEAPAWEPKRAAVEEALRLWTSPGAQMAEFRLQPHEVGKELAGLASTPETRMGVMEEMHFNAVIRELGRMKVGQSRNTLKRIAEKSSGRILQEVSIRAIGDIGVTADSSFVCDYAFAEDIDVRREAIVALGKLGDESTIRVLERVIAREHEAPRNKRLAEDAIKAIQDSGRSR